MGVGHGVDFDRIEAFGDRVLAIGAWISRGSGEWSRRAAADRRRLYGTEWEDR